MARIGRPISVIDFESSTKRCYSCLFWLKFELFSRNKNGSFGLNAKCKNCHSFAEKVLKERNPSRFLSKKRENRLKNLDSAKASAQNWSRTHTGNRAAIENKRRAAKLQALPKWAEVDKIKEFYLKCPSNHHVDHFFPLQGKTVCGLHVLGNLRYLSATANARKGNKHPEEFHDQSMA